MPFQGSTIATTEAELWGLQDSVENATNTYYNLAALGAYLGGPQDGVFGELQNVDTELNSSGGPRGWLPGVLAAIIALIFGSVAWLNQGLDNWVQWAVNNAVDGFNDFLEGIRAFIEGSAIATSNAIIGTFNRAQNVGYLAINQEQGDVSNIRILINDVYVQEQSDVAQLRNQEAGDVSNIRILINDVYVQEQSDVAQLQQTLSAQEQSDFGNLKNLIDQNFFTLQQQERADTQNLQTQINGIQQPNVSALQQQINGQILPQLIATTALATQTQQQLNTDEQQCIDPLCQNLGNLSKDFGLLNQLGVAAAVIAFIAACMNDPAGVAGGVNTLVTPTVDSTSFATTGV